MKRLVHAFLPALLLSFGCEPAPADPARPAAPADPATPSDPGLAPSAPTAATPAASVVRVEVAPGLELAYDPSNPMLPAWRNPLAKVGPKADQADDIRYEMPDRYAITVTPPTGVRGMVEWEPMQAIVMSIPGYVTGASYANTLGTVLSIAKESVEVAEVWFVVPNATVANTLQTKLVQKGVSQETVQAKVRFLTQPIDSIWFIDSGPLPLVAKDGTSFAISDFRYYHDRPLDDGIPTWLGRQLPFLGYDHPTVTYRMPINVEGGTYQTTTDGVCFTGDRQIYYMTCDDGGCQSTVLTMSLANVQKHAKALELKSIWKDYAGCEDVIVTNSITDDGTGHIDMYLKVLDDDRVLIGQYVEPFANAKQKENAALLDLNAAYIESYVKPNGKKFTVERLIMPGHKNDPQFGATPFTYINSTFINGKNLWPAFTYSDWVASRNAAEAKWKEVLPEYEHIWIDSQQLSFASGAIHCITRTIPVVDAGLWVADGTCKSDQCEAPAGGYSGECSPNGIAYDVCYGPEWLCTCNDCESGCNYNPGEDPCLGISYEGCCSGTQLWYCDGDLKKFDCGGSCGWDGGSGWYDCGFSGSDPSGQFPKSCADVIEECEPSCAGKECGDNGCGGVCGTCAAGKACNQGICVTADDPCDGMTFAGCCDGNTVKWCENQKVNQQVCTATQGCGWTTQQSYYACGNKGKADPSGENPYSCDELVCVPDCSGKTCGDDGCGGLCGTCGAGDKCEAGKCVVACVPSCEGKQCGDDGCGSVCGSCAGQSTCKEGVCVPNQCLPDCAEKTCGDDGCGGTCGACTDGKSCQAGKCVQTACEASCAGKVCGDDGCGGTCGGCAPDHECTAAGQCVPEKCVGSCVGKACGDDGCGGSCGSCGPSEVCEEFACVDAPPEPDPAPEPGPSEPEGPVCGCDGKACGDDGCGVSCGICGPGELCQAGQCAAVAGCGDITQDGECQGTAVVWCEGGALQSFDCASQAKNCGFKEDVGFTCIDPPNRCVAACDGKVCGDDGCGGSCGACADGEVCAEGQCAVDPGTPEAEPGTPEAEPGTPEAEGTNPEPGTGEGGSDDEPEGGTVPVAGGTGGGSGVSSCQGSPAPGGAAPIVLVLLSLLAVAVRRRA